MEDIDGKILHKTGQIPSEDDIKNSKQKKEQLLKELDLFRQ
jgi:hypothetical protein